MSFESRTSDAASEEILQKAADEGMETFWDRYEEMQPQCGFGSTGLCCTNCLQGPCRIDPFGEGPSEGICGLKDYSMVARNLVRTITGGTASHSDHARHVGELLREVADGHIEDYEVKDEEKLEKVADKLEIDTEGKDVGELTKEVAEEAVGNFIGFHGEEMSFLKPMIPEARYDIFKKCDIVATGINDVINQSIHRTAMGMDADPLNLIFGGLKTALADFVGCTIGTDLSDIFFGTPEPVESEANLGVLDEDAVNLIVHGHEPVLSEKIIEAARRLEDEAKEAGAENGVNVVGICCTGNELLMRQGAPLVANYASQELAIMTGAADAMVVDIQCIMPSLKQVTDCYHTELITTMPHVKIPGAKHMQFDDSNANKDADEIVRTAIDAFKRRNQEKINIPEHKSKLMAGFSVEALMDTFSQIDEEDPLSVITDAIAAGDIRGIALFAGCNNVKTPQDGNHIAVAKELVKNDVLCLATGCVANAFGKNGLLLPEAVEEYAGDGLKKFFNEAADALGTELPLIFHMGSCVDNSRAVELATALANKLGVDLGDLPLVASAPEAMHEKAVSIGCWAVSLGLPTHVGVPVPITGSSLVTEVGTKIAKDVFDGYFIVETDPEAAADKLLAEIDERKWLLEMKDKAQAKEV